ncbi:MAG: hypothetical protein RSE50_00790 [Myroides sp.]
MTITSVLPDYLAKIKFIEEIDCFDHDFHDYEEDVDYTFISDYYIVELEDADYMCENGKSFLVGQFVFSQNNGYDSDLLNITCDISQLPTIEEVVNQGNDVFFSSISDTNDYELDVIKNAIKISDII